MSGLPKRSALKSSPEDQVHYRKFHDHVLTKLREGVAQEDLLKELVAGGVPEKTADRIVYSVQQEVDHATYSSQISHGKFWISTAATGILVFLVAAYAAWQMGEQRRIPLKVAVPGLFVIIAAMTFVFGRYTRRMKPPLDPPPWQ